MSRIDKLIAKLCPEGVEFVPLGMCAAYSSTRVNSNELDQTNFVGVDNLLQNTRGKIDASYPPNTARLTAYEVGDILIGNIRPYLKKIWLADNYGGCSGDVLAIRITQQYRQRLLPEFLYYPLSSYSFFSYNMRHAKGAKMPRGSKDAILKFPIPVPPIEVQREIVKVLDPFTELEAEMEAEMEARRRQYEYYRGALLTFDNMEGNPLRKLIAKLCPRGVEFKELGEVASYTRGVTYSKNDERPDGPIRVLRSNNITLSSNTINFDDVKAVSGEVRVRDDQWLLANDILISSASGSKKHVGKVAYINENIDYCFGGFMATIRTTEQINSRFLFYLLIGNKFNAYLEKALSTTTINNLNASIMKAFPIPIPPIEVQREIAGILDKFDALVNSLSSGLPAEIKARRRQYQYYRDRLLTFKMAQ